MIPSEGPFPCPFLFIGEYPGVEEHRVGRPFVGKAGQEFRRYLNGYELPHPDAVHLTNLKFAPPEKKGTYELTDAEHEAIWNTIDAVQPKIIITLGAHVLKYFCGDDATLEGYHGIPHAPVPAPTGVMRAVRLGTIIFPAYNPAAMLHSPTLQSFFAYDMRRLSLCIKGKLPEAPRDERPGVYALAEDRIEARDTLDVSVDTEGWEHLPWGLSYSGQAYTGWVVRKGAPVIPELVKFWRLMKRRLTLHNSLHDLGVLRALGADLDLDEIPFDDTMIMAYLLGLEPQGLKPLMYRHAGAKQDDYSDVVAIPNAAIAERWLTELVDRLPVLVKAVKAVKKTGQAAVVPPAYTPTEIELGHARTLIERMVAKNEPYTLRTRWAACRAREILADELELLSPYEADPPEATLDEIDLDTAVNYAGRDSDGTERVRPPLKQQIAAMGLEDVYHTDLAIVPMIDRMQTVGIQADLPHFKGLVEVFTAEEVINREEIRRVCKRDINPNSGDQVAEFLFDQQQLDMHPEARYLRLKRTKTGVRISTNDKILEALSSLHPAVKLFQEGREIRKLNGTYARPMPWLVGRDSRLHPHYRLTRAETGRLTAANPNILALPKHSERGKLIRAGLLAGEGFVFSEWDLSQIEMVVFAHDSGDEVMLDEIRRGLDKHVATATRIFKKTYDEMFAAYKRGDAVAEQERFAAKAVNFGILMGITAFGLLDQFHKNGQLHWTLDMCEDVLRGWHRAYPQGSAYIDEKHAEARRHGFVRDMFGRLRWLEGVHSADKYIAQEALRQAQATPVQSGAQGIIKRGMGALWPILKRFRAEGMEAECLLQVHDALVLEHRPEDGAVLDDAVMTCLCDVVTLKIPIKAKSKMGVSRLSEL